MWNEADAAWETGVASGILGGVLAGLLLANRGPYTRIKLDGYGWFSSRLDPHLFAGDEVVLAFACGAACAALATLAVMACGRRYSRERTSVRLFARVFVLIVVAISLVVIPLVALYLLDGNAKLVPLLLVSLLALVGMLAVAVIASGMGLLVIDRRRGAQGGPSYLQSDMRTSLEIVAVWAVLMLTLVATGIWLTESYVEVPGWLRREPGIAHSAWVYAPVFVVIMGCTVTGTRLFRLRTVYLTSITAGTVVGAVVVAALAASVLAAANPGPYRLTPTGVGSVDVYYAIQLLATVFLAVGLPLLATFIVHALAIEPHRRDCVPGEADDCLPAQEMSA